MIRDHKLALSLVTGLTWVFLGGSGVVAQPSVEQLPVILQLQLNQQPAWRDYRDAAAQSEVEQVRQASSATQLNAMNTPARLEALRQQLGAQQQAFERQAAATVRLYAVLSPEQRHVFDDVTRLPTPRLPGQPSNPSGTSPRLLRIPPPQAGLPPLAP